MEKEELYTKNPKWLNEVIKRGEVKHLEARILLDIADFTVGFKKPIRPMTVRQIAESINAHPNHVRTYLRGLIDKGLVVETPEGIGLGNQATRSVAQATKSVATKSVASDQQNLLQKPTKSVASTPAKAIDSARLQTPKENTKKNSKKIPPTPQGGTGGFVYPEWFEKVWAAGPWKEGKKPTYLAASKYKPDEAMVTAFLEGIARWQLSKRWAEGYVCHGTTFFNQERWREYPEQAGKVVNIAPSEKTSEANPWESKPWAALWVGFANLPRRGSMRDIVEWLASKGRSLDWYDYDEQRALVKTFYEQGEDAALSRYWSMVPKKKEA